jgi:hypothetical protein
MAKADQEAPVNIFGAFMPPFNIYRIRLTFTISKSDQASIYLGTNEVRVVQSGRLHECQQLAHILPKIHLKMKIRARKVFMEQFFKLLSMPQSLITTATPPMFSPSSTPRLYPPSVNIRLLS